jgi:hypothetical protein
MREGTLEKADNLPPAVPCWKIRAFSSWSMSVLICAMQADFLDVAKQETGISFQVFCSSASSGSSSGMQI